MKISPGYRRVRGRTENIVSFLHVNVSAVPISSREITRLSAILRRRFLTRTIFFASEIAPIYVRSHGVRFGRVETVQTVGVSFQERLFPIVADNKYGT